MIQKSSSCKANKRHLLSPPFSVPSFKVSHCTQCILNMCTPNSPNLILYTMYFERVHSRLPWSHTVYNVFWKCALLTALISYCVQCILNVCTPSCPQASPATVSSQFHDFFSWPTESNQCCSYLHGCQVIHRSVGTVPGITAPDKTECLSQ